MFPFRITKLEAAFLFWPAQPDFKGRFDVFAKLAQVGLVPFKQLERFRCRALFTRMLTFAMRNPIEASGTVCHYIFFILSRDDCCYHLVVDG